MKFLFFCLLVSLFVVPSAVAGKVHLSAAASTADVLREMVAGYRQSHPDTKILFNLAGSGTLARQIAQGAPADIYISANPRWMDYLVDQNRVSRESMKTWARNVLVFVGSPKSEVAGLEDLPHLSRIALGSPAGVPAGEYAKATLRKAGLYEELTHDGKLVMARDVRQALIYADHGEADGAFVYRTDAALARHVIILFEVPGGLCPPILYLAALTESGMNNKDAVSFYHYLFSVEARERLRKYGFVANWE